MKSDKISFATGLLFLTSDLKVGHYHLSELARQKSCNHSTSKVKQVKWQLEEKNVTRWNSYKYTNSVC